MKNDVYALVTERITAALKAGTVPWQKPWSGGGLPRNLITRRPYRGVNVLLLSLQPYGSPWWLTFKQARDLGGTVRRGERASVVTFWKIAEPDPSNPEAEREEQGSKRRAPILRYYNVFNYEQTDGLPTPPDLVAPKEHAPIQACEAIVAGMPERPEIRPHPASAFYDPVRDYVAMPGLNRFETAEAYYGTLFHELVHSTGHPSRLDRSMVARPTPFGSPGYSKEELVAELGACFLCGIAGIFPQVADNSASYLQGWLSALQQDRRLLVVAAAQAQKAADYILGRLEEEGPVAE